MNRRAFTLVELIVVIAVLLVLMAVVLPSFLGVRGSAQDRAVQSNITVAYHDAKTAWAETAAYPALAGTEGLLSQLGSAEPGFAFVTGTPAVVAKELKVSRQDDQTVTICGKSATGRFFCLRANEEGALFEAADHRPAGPSFQAAASATVARSSATSLELAECLLPTSSAASTCAGDEPGEGTAGWSSTLSVGDDSAPEEPPAPTASVSFTDPQADTGAGRPSFAFAFENADTAECSLDGAGFAPCDSPYKPLVDAGEHSITVRVTGSNGAAEDTHTFTAWSAPSIFLNTQAVTGTTSRTDQSVTYSISNAHTVTCYLDEQVSPCATNLFSAATLSAGPHTGRVVVANPGGSMTATLQPWTVATYASIVNANNPARYFRFAETGAGSQDEAGQSTITWSSGASQATGLNRNGAGTGRAFDGSGGGVITGMPSLTGNFAIETWVKPAAGPSTVQPLIFLNNDTFIGLSPLGGDTWNVVFAMPGTAINSGTTAAGTLQAGVWSHIAVNFNNGTARIYINGVAQSAEAGISPLVAPPTTWQIAQNGFGAFTGAMDELAVYTAPLSGGIFFSHAN